MSRFRTFYSRIPTASILIGVVFGLAAGGYVVYRGTSSPVASDFDQLWHGARGAWRGVSPYTVVGPGREFSWDYLFYPMPAIVVAMPFALMPLLVARAAFAGISAGLLAGGLWRFDREKLLAFASAPMFIALGRGQASPLLLACSMIPVLAWVGAFKPNIAIALLPVSRNVRVAIIAGAIGTLVLLGISFGLQPDWIAQWRDALRQKNDSAPVIVRFGGFLILLALLRWRQREAWLVLLLACLPQTPSFYDAVPLFAVPKGLRQTAVMALCGNLAFLALVSGVGFPPAAAYGVRVTTLSVLFLYLPAVVLLFLQPARSRSAESGDALPPARHLSRTDIAVLVTLGISAVFAFWGTVAKYRA